jgi:hypothetical protein
MLTISVFSYANKLDILKSSSIKYLKILDDTWKAVLQMHGWVYRKTWELIFGAGNQVWAVVDGEGQTWSCHPGSARNPRWSRGFVSVAVLSGNGRPCFGPWQCGKVESENIV